MDLIKKYFTQLNPIQEKQFSDLGRLYRHWNARINVVSRKDIDQLEIRHILHSLSIARLISFKPGTHILDVGTGGGFPGIPLAIMFPESTFTLADSIGKKIKVVGEISSAIGLTNIIPLHTRVEKIPDRFDFIVSRAVTRLPVFISWVKDKFKQNSFNELHNGILYLKGGDFQNELDEVISPVRIFDIADLFEEDFFETKKIVYVMHEGSAWE